jgi:hypothetical protein
MKSFSRNLLVLLAVGCLSMAVAFSKIAAQGSSGQEQHKFEEPDDPKTKGQYTPKTDAASVENVSYGSGSVPHGIYVHTNRPACQGTPGSSSNEYSVCTTVNVYIPLTGHVDAVAGFARETGSTAWSPCYSPQQDCAIGWSTFDPGYQIYTTPSNTVVAWTFKNWSHNRARDAMVAVSWH